MGRAEQIKLFLQGQKEIEGHVTCTIRTNGRPIHAIDFAKTIIDMARCLRACDESKQFDWAIIEANMIDDAASFTLKGYPKEVFKAKRSVTKNQKPTHDVPG